MAMFLSVPVMAQSSVGELEKEDFLQAVDSVVQAVVEEEADSLELLIPVKIDSILVDSIARQQEEEKRKKTPPRLSSLLAKYCVLKLAPGSSEDSVKVDTVSILYEQYVGVLDYLNNPQTPERYIATDPKYYKLFLPYTFYYSPMREVSELKWEFRTPYDSVPDLAPRLLPFDSEPFTAIGRADEVVDRMLLASYPACSRNIVLTEDEVMQSRVFRDNIGEKMTSYSDDGTETETVFTEDYARSIQDVINSTVTVSGRTSGTLSSIINEEAEGFFAGQKSADEVARNIQNRASIYVNEQR